MQTKCSSFKTCVCLKLSVKLLEREKDLFVTYHKHKRKHITVMMLPGYPNIKFETSEQGSFEATINVALRTGGNNMAKIVFPFDVLPCVLLTNKLFHEQKTISIKYYDTYLRRSCYLEGPLNCG